MNGCWSASRNSTAPTTAPMGIDGCGRRCGVPMRPRPWPGAPVDGGQRDRRREAAWEAVAEPPDVAATRPNDPVAAQLPG